MREANHAGESGKSKTRPYTIDVINTVCASNLPQDLRHVLMVMAHLADHRTGRGLSSQETIARAMGCGAREVRRKLDRLARIADSPVQVVRRSRPRADGRGRTSDEYHLVLTSNLSEAGPTGRPRPLDDATNRTSTTDQPDVYGTTNRTPTSYDPVRDPGRSDPVSVAAPPRTPSSSKDQRAAKKTDVSTWQGPTDDDRVLAALDGVDVEIDADKFRAHAQSKGRMETDWTAAYRLWLLESVARRRASAAPKAPTPGSVAPAASAEDARRRAELMEEALRQEREQSPVYGARRRAELMEEGLRLAREKRNVLAPPTARMAGAQGEQPDPPDLQRALQDPDYQRELTAGWKSSPAYDGNPVPPAYRAGVARAKGRAA